MTLEASLTALVAPKSMCAPMSNTYYLFYFIYLFIHLLIYFEISLKFFYFILFLPWRVTQLREAIKDEREKGSRWQSGLWAHACQGSSIAIHVCANCDSPVIYRRKYVAKVLCVKIVAGPCRIWAENCCWIPWTASSPILERDAWPAFFILRLAGTPGLHIIVITSTFCRRRCGGSRSSQENHSQEDRPRSLRYRYDMSVHGVSHAAEIYTDM